MTATEHDTALRAILAGLRDRLRPRARLKLRDDERLDGRTVMITGGNRGWAGASPSCSRVAARG